jgi:hypothetical protein
MGEFGLLVKESQKKISALMKEWDDVQIEIIRLAAEVFGPDAIVAPLPRISGEPQLDIKEAVKRAKADYDRKEAKHQDFIKAVDEIDEKSEELKTGTLRTLKEQQKVCLIHIRSSLLTRISGTSTEIQKARRRPGEACEVTRDRRISISHSAEVTTAAAVYDGVQAIFHQGLSGREEDSHQHRGQTDPLRKFNASQQLP